MTVATTTTAVVLSAPSGSTPLGQDLATIRVDDNDLDSGQDSDWLEYLRAEAHRRGISIAAVRREEESASEKLAQINLAPEKLRAAARNAQLDHPYLTGDDDESPF